MAAQQLHYTDRGQGFPLLILHGLFGSIDNWNQIAKGLEENHRIIQVDLRNHGKSFHHPEMNYLAMAQDVINLLDYLELEQANILGHSMGGKVAMELALAYPEKCHQLIIVDIAPRTYHPRHNDVFAGLNAVNLSKVAHRKDAEKALNQHVVDKMVAQFLLKGLYRSDTGFKWRFNVPVLEQEYKNLIAAPATDAVFHNPTLFIKGMQSDYIEASDRPGILKLFPNADAKIISDTGHWPHAEKPRLLLNLIEKFLSKNR